MFKAYLWECNFPLSLAWNVIAFLVVLTSLVEVTLGSVGGGNLASLRTLRLLKVLRAFRLVRRAKRLRNMVLALASSVPSILSTISFICLFLFTVAVLGTQFFSGVREGYGIHQHNNFRTVWKGLQLLLRVITGKYVYGGSWWLIAPSHYCICQRLS